MADIRDRDRHLHAHAHAQMGHRDNWSGNSGPSASQVAAVVTLLPVGGTLLALAGLTLVGTLIGLAVATPLFLLFSPVLVPAAFLTALAVTAFLASGLFGVTGLSSLSWVLACLREAAQRQLPQQLDHTKRRMADVAAYVGQKTKETGQTIQHKAHETAGARTTAST